MSSSVIAITGAAGHIGNVLIRELIKKGGHTIRALILKGEDTSSLADLDVEKVEGDVLDVESLKKVFKGADTVYHLASVIAISKGTEKLVELVNVQGTKNVMKACRVSGVRRLVYTSSIHALREPTRGTAFTEECGFYPEEKKAIYEKTKAQASLDVLNEVKDGLDAIIVCPTGVIGPYDFKISEMGALCRQYAKKQLKAYVDGAYDFVDVRDVAQGHILAAEKGKKGEVYILSGGQISVKEMLLILQDATGIPAPKLKLPVWFVNITAPLSAVYYRLLKMKPLFTAYSIKTLVSNSLVNSKKARNELGFISRPLSESLHDQINWMVGNNIITLS
ncbi:SDR family oxidoreductase [Patescibacteria group bacterium]